LNRIARDTTVRMARRLYSAPHWEQRSFPARAAIKSESAGLFCGQTLHVDVVAYAR